MILLNLIKKKEKMLENNNIPFKKEENISNLHLFERYLKLIPRGFVLCQSSASDKFKIMEYFKNTQFKDYIISWDMSNPPQNALSVQLSLLKYHSENKKPKLMFFIYNIENCVSILTKDKNYKEEYEQYKDYLGDLNYIRDFFFRFNSIFVFFMTEETKKYFIRYAFDFYDWMKSIYIFTPEEEKQQQTQIISPIDLFKIEDFEAKKQKYTNMEEKIEYFEQLNRRLKEEIEISYNLKELGELYYQIGKLDLSLARYNQSLAIDEKLGYKEGIGENYIKIGWIYEDRGDYSKSLEFYNKSLEIFEELDDKRGIARVILNIGNIYESLGDYDKALEFYNKSLKISEELGYKSGIGKSIGNIGMIYQDKGDYDKALEFYNKSLKIKEELGDIDGIASSKTNIGLIYLEKKKYHEAFDCFIESYKIFKKLGSRKLQIVIDNLNKLKKFILKEQFNKKLIENGIDLEELG